MDGVQERKQEAYGYAFHTLIDKRSHCLHQHGFIHFGHNLAACGDSFGNLGTELARCKKGGDLRLEPDGVDRGSHLASQLQDILETLCGDQPGTRATTLDNSISGHSGAMNEALYTFSRSEEHTSELQSLMRISYAVF